MNAYGIDTAQGRRQGKGDTEGGNRFFRIFKPGQKGMPAGWTARPSAKGGQASATRDTQVVHSGQGSLKMSLTGPASISAGGPTVAVTGGKDYVVIIWYRAQGFSKTGGHEGVSSQWMLNWLNSRGKHVGRSGSGFPYRAMDWGVGTLVATAPRGAVRAQMSFHFHAKQGTLPSTVWVDDIVLMPLPRAKKQGTPKWIYNVVRLHNYPRTAFRQVADDDASEGVAVLADVKRSPKNKYPCGGIYTNDPTPGIYTVHYRVKAAAAKSPKPALTIDVGCQGGAWSGLAGRDVKANELRPAGKYQDLTLRFVCPPLKTPRVDYRVRWLGVVSTWVDTVSVVPEHLFTPAAQQRLFSLPAKPKPGKPKPIDPSGARTAPTPGPLEAHLTSAAKWPKPRDKRKYPTLQVTRDSYLATVRQFGEGAVSTLKAHTNLAKPYPNIHMYVNNMKWVAFLYHVTRDEAYARLGAKALECARRLLQHPKADSYYRTGKHDAFDLYRFDQWMGGSQAYTARHQQMLRDLVRHPFPSFPAKQVEYGAMNRPIAMATAAQIALKMVPDLPDRRAWQTYMHAIWNEWWPRRDFNEATGNYNALAFRYLVDWIDALGQAEKVYGDQGFQKLMERFMRQVFPVGTLPHYGDTNGWNVEWGHWIMLCEIAARYTKDGRYKWAAHRLYEYATTRIEKLTSWAYTGQHCGESLMIAYLMADDTIQEVAPTDRLRALVRVKLAVNPLDVRRKTRRSFRMVDGTMPDKLVMVAGPERQATSLMVDACPLAGHNPGTPTALVSLVDRGSVLLVDSGYNDRQRTDHNMLCIEDYDGIPLLNDGKHAPGISWLPLYGSEKIRYERLAEMTHGSYARVSVTGFQNYPCRAEREVLLVNGLGAMVRDTVRFDQAVRVRMGPVYNVRQLGPATGDTWFNSTMGEWVPVRGIYVNQPIYTRWANPPRDLLVAFQPMDNARLEVLHRAAYDKTTPLPYRVQYTWRGQVEKGNPLSFATLLLPHKPTRQPSALAERVVFTRLDGGGCVVRLDLGRSQRYLVMNPAGTPCDLGPVQTNARFGLVHVRGGRIAAASLGQVSRVAGPGLSELSGTAIQERFDYTAP